MKSDIDTKIEAQIKKQMERLEALKRKAKENAKRRREAEEAERTKKQQAAGEIVLRWREGNYATPLSEIKSEIEKLFATSEATLDEKPDEEI